MDKFIFNAINKDYLFLLVAFNLLILFQPVLCHVKLPRLIGDGMVLQRDTNVQIWGWASPAEKIEISFLEENYQTKADKNGKWIIKLSGLKAGGPYSMQINADNHITLKNILIGDIWLCSGQSNMELTMDWVKEAYKDEILHSENTNIRQFLIPHSYDFKTSHDDLPEVKWESANPQTVLHFTAAGYFFAKELYQKYKVPIGLINASLGGSPVEAWMSEDAIKEFPGHFATAIQFRDDALIGQIEQSDKKRIDAWHNLLKKSDKGVQPGQKQWFDPAYDASGWPAMQIPAFWDEGDLGPLNGSVWFRKEISIPDSMVGKPAIIRLGAIVDMDYTYLNGRFVGTTSYKYPPRRYDISADILKPGKNILTIRVINTAERGGFIKNKPYQLSAGGITIDLSGEWQYQPGATMEPLVGETTINRKPTGLYNAMISPLLDFSIRGVIWYQGESNTENPQEYQKLFPALIQDWRDKFNQGDFPFLYVQLANYMHPKDQPSESNWAELREAQLKTLQVKNTAMVVTTDIGEWNDIHPVNKKDVGVRLSKAAQKLAYGEDIVYSGPVYKSMKTEGNKIILTFDHIGSGLVAKGKEGLKYFAICGADKKFVWAKAEIKDNKVIVRNDKIDHPLAVRYAWADDPEDANLYNMEGFPASPFRTDE